MMSKKVQSLRWFWDQESDALIAKIRENSDEEMYSHYSIEWKGNPDKWVDEFFNYDYIGAPFPIPVDGDNITYRDPFGNLIRVGNGGFSLRSKKILSLGTELGLEWKSYFGYYNEDGFFTCHNRHIYEKNGCVYAPVEVAAKFSHERQTSETIGITPFGFHGKDNKNNYKI